MILLPVMEETRARKTKEKITVRKRNRDRRRKTSGYERSVWGLSKIAASVKGELLPSADVWSSSPTRKVHSRWAFVDFTSTQHATASLINPRNHSLDGRKLVVEYASPDAVRRGGGPRESNIEGGGGRKVRKPKSAGYIRNKPKSAAGRVTEDGEKKLNKKERKAEKVTRKLEKDLGRKYGAVERASTGKGERPKPGAALALAQRGTAAILPSQGQKIAF